VNIHLFAEFCLIAVLRAECGVLQSQVTAYEMDTVQLSCFTNYPEQVEWRINSRFQRGQIEGHRDSRKIYSTGHRISEGFLQTRRYLVSAEDGFYNLTIMRVNMSEAGEYICHEALQNGPRTSTLLTVLGMIQTCSDLQPTK